MINVKNKLIISIDKTNTIFKTFLFLYYYVKMIFNMFNTLIDLVLNFYLSF